MKLLKIIGAITVILSFLITVYYLFRKEYIRRLKMQKSILDPIITLKIEDFINVRTEQNKSIKSTIYKYDCEKIYYKLKSIDINKIRNKKIKNKLKSVLNIEKKGLIICNSKDNVFHHFHEDLENLIHETKIYLSEILSV